MELIVGAGRPVETWSGSSLWANRPYAPTATYFFSVVAGLKGPTHSEAKPPEVVVL